MALSIPTNIPAAGAKETRKKGRRTRDLIEADEKKNSHKLSSDQFDHMIALISDGVSIPDVLITCNVTRYALDGVLRNNEAARAKYEEAKILAIYRHIDFDTLEDIFSDIASGITAKQSCEDRFVDPGVFYKLVLKDPLAKELYQESRQIQMESMADEILTIADDDTRDMAFDKDGGDRPNSAAVQRDRLKADNRKWLMSRLHHERFGDRKQIDLEANVNVNYAERLEGARKRKAAARMRE